MNTWVHSRNQIPIPDGTCGPALSLAVKANGTWVMNEEKDLASAITGASERVKRQRALVVDLAKAKRFEEMPAAHQVLRQMEDELKLARATRTPH